jgi:RHS repeat-associated protein
MASSPPLIHVTNYEYNAADELLRLTRNFREPPGDPVLFAGPGAPNTPTAFVTSFSYDGNGSRTSKTADEQPHPTAYTWDARQRMTSVVTGPEVFTAGYDPFHQRVKVREGRKERITLVDGGITANRLLYTEEGSDKGSGKGMSARREIWLGGQRVGAVSNGSLTLYHADALGSVIAQSDVSGSLHRTYYKPFGEARSGSDRTPDANRIGFAGALGIEHDLISGMHFMWFRMYVSNDAIFISREPLVFRWSGQLRYGYAFSNPVRWSDSSGPDPLNDELGELDRLAADGDQEAAAKAAQMRNDLAASTTNKEIVLSGCADASDVINTVAKYVGELANVIINPGKKIVWPAIKQILRPQELGKDFE